MRIRKEQLDSLKVEPYDIRRNLRDIIQAEGRKTELDPESGDLLIYEDNFGISRITFDEKGRADNFHGVDGRVYTFEYDEDNKRAPLVDGEGYKTLFEYKMIFNLLQSLMLRDIVKNFSTQKK